MLHCDNDVRVAHISTGSSNFFGKWYSDCRPGQPG
jgi:hypothetical protein